MSFELTFRIVSKSDANEKYNWRQKKKRAHAAANAQIKLLHQKAKEDGSESNLDEGRLFNNLIIQFFSPKPFPSCITEAAYLAPYTMDSTFPSNFPPVSTQILKRFFTLVPRDLATHVHSRQ